MGVYKMLSRPKLLECNTGTGNSIDCKKLLRDVIRGSLIETEHIPVPLGGPISPDDEHDELCDVLNVQELAAYAQLVAEIKAEAIAASETRLDLLREFDKVIAECDGAPHV
jgi:hypothetical protein